MIKSELKATVKPRLNLSLLLRHNIELLDKSSEELQQALEEEQKHNPYITHVFKRIPKWFFKEEIKQREAVAKDSVFEEVSKQINLEFEGIDKEIALEILYRCDADGFFKDNPEEIGKLYGVSVEYVEDIREFIMTEIEPVGIASKNLEGFIIVQLQEMYPQDIQLQKSVMQAIKTGHVDPQVKEIIFRLGLKPLGSEPVPQRTGTVDLVLEHDGEDWYIFIQEDFIDFHIEEDVQVQDEVQKEKLRRAKSLRIILEMRRRLLREIGKSIVHRQEDFLLRGKPLKTLTLKEISQNVGISMSTVSRLVNSKYAKTPAGIYPLRFFFVKESKSGMSKEEVMRAIKEVLQENMSISDSKVATMLKERGIDIARRTVAKYRKLLGLR